MNIQKYKSKIVSAEQAVKVIKSGDKIVLHANSNYPELLVNALCDRYQELNDVEIAHLTIFQKPKYLDPLMEGHFRHNALFTSGPVRKAVNEGKADFTPVFLHEIPLLFESGRLKVDVVFLHLSCPDEHGFCSFGTSNEITKTASENAKIVIAQINPNMPRVLGDNFIHIDKIDYIVETDTSLVEVLMVDKDLPDEEKKIYQTIGGYIASLIKDGDTLQMGIGTIPDAVLPYLKEKNDLGIHTEMFSDGLIKLIDMGIVNGDKKTLLPGKIVSSFVIASKVCFDYINNNPFIEFRTTKFVNDPYTIARNDNMVSINSAIQVDITGQICADSMGHRIFSGFGGQVDFIRGASRSKNGRPIIALPSTAKSGQISRIVDSLTSGAGVTTSRGDVHYVITEYGIADLHGKTVRERAKELIKIAHPKFRDELEMKAREYKYIW
jgi:acetyl-CoA hydrolase